MEVLDSVVIGAGQAGLAASYFLLQRRLAHVVLDANPDPGGAWQHRWDSLSMNDVHGVAAPDWLSGSVQLGDVMTYPVYRLFISAVCIVVALAMWAVLTRSRLGMRIRAGASNREMVRAMGIDIRLLYRVVFAIGVALAALAGMIAAPVSSVYPNMGASVLIICFVVVVIGGIGSITGALVASLLVGFVDTFGKVFFAEVAGMGVYVLMAIILIWRPEGLMGRKA